MPLKAIKNFPKTEISMRYLLKMFLPSKIKPFGSLGATFGRGNYFV